MRINPYKPSAKVTSLDGLRAICALGVVAYHMGLAWLPGGLIGVTVLFVISGYLITSGLLAKWHETGKIDYLSFLKRRVSRIYPSAIAYIAIVGAVLVFVRPQLLSKMAPDVVPALAMVINWTKIFANESYFAAAGSPSPLTHFWSLAIEMQFYVIWPLVLALLLGMRKKGPIIGVHVLLIAASAILMAVLYVPNEDPTRVYYGLDTRAMSLVAGSLLAFIWPAGVRSRQGVWRMPVHGRIVLELGGALGIAGIVACMLLVKGNSTFPYYGGTLLITLFSAMAVAALMPRASAVSTVMAFPPLAWLGSRSFALYLWHYPVIELMTNRASTLQVQPEQRLAQLAVSLAAAEISYRLFEGPLAGKPLFDSMGKTFSAIFTPRRKGFARGLLLFAVCAALALTGGIAAWGFTHAPEAGLGGQAASTFVTKATLKKPLVDGQYDVVFFGDSVGAGARHQLSEAFPHGAVDVEASRQYFAILDAFRALDEQGVVGDTVVMHIGSNGWLDDPGVMDEIVNTVGTQRELWLVNVRVEEPRCSDNNRAIQDAVDRYDNVHLIDWYGASAGHDEYFYEDGIHLANDEARWAYTNLIVDTMGYVQPTVENTHFEPIFIGDAGAILSGDAVASAFPKGAVDIAEGRSFEDVVDAYRSYRDQGVILKDVLIACGYEYALDAARFEEFCSEVEADGFTLWLINNHSIDEWCLPNNQVMSDAASAHANIRLIDWFAASEGQDGYFDVLDGSMTAEGGAAYADLVVNSYQPSVSI